MLERTLLWLLPAIITILKMLGITFLCMLPAIITMIIPLFVRYLQFKNIPEKVEQVEIAEKNKRLCDADGTPYYTYFITFKFSDGAKREFLFSTGSEKDVAVFGTMQKNDRGTLTYKERENAVKKIKNERRHYNGRHFINFKRDTGFDDLNS